MDTTIMTPMSSKEVNNELDSLALRQLLVLQDYLTLRSDMSNIMSHGFVQLAKSRMVLGQNSLVSSSCFGTSEEDTETAMITSNVGEVSNTENSSSGSVTRVLSSELDNEEQKKYLAKVRQKMGGFMSPGSLQLAQSKFSSTLERCLEVVNLQQQLEYTITRIEQLKIRKNDKQ